jgi:hypothetical protein
MSPERIATLIVLSSEMRPQNLTSRLVGLGTAEQGLPALAEWAMSTAIETAVLDRFPRKHRATLCRSEEITGHPLFGRPQISIVSTVLTVGFQWLALTGVAHGGGDKMCPKHRFVGQSHQAWLDRAHTSPHAPHPAQRRKPRLYSRSNFCSVWQVGSTKPRLPPADCTTSPT